ncbi:acyl-CoA dehydrogenase [Pseudonocardia xishanensis]|uniref:Acyl-CoA dehydrogenase family protein n=1 Tax=Pseudonocardia xishanensis TaxID=630995 RepID=A0ABP8S061_9PSEU
MDLMLTAEQAELQNTARRYAERNLAFQHEPGAAPARPAIETMRAMAELGWTSLGIPEDEHGAGGGVLELCLVLEELGRVGAITPLASTATVVLPMIAARVNGSDPRLREAADGTLIATLGLLDDGARDEWESSAALCARRDGDGWLVDGRIGLVPWAVSAGLVALRCELDEAGPALVLLPTDRSGVVVTAQEAIGPEPRASVSLAGVRISGDDVLASGPDGAELVVSTRDIATVLQTAWAVGAAEAALGLSVEYAKQREQFGRAIATYQAVSHRCADMRMGIDALRLMIWETAWAIDHGRSEVVELVASTKAFADDVFGLTIVNAHQVHGAIGYSMEYPLQHYTRILKTAQLELGGPGRQLERIAIRLGL